MKKSRFLLKTSSLILAAILTGCGAGGPGGSIGTIGISEAGASGGDAEQAGTSGGQPDTQTYGGASPSKEYKGKDISYEVNPGTFSLSLITDEGVLQAASPVQERKVEQFEKNGEETAWRYPEDNIAISIKPEKDYLSVAITSETEDDNAFAWPEIDSGSYYFPLGEGKRVPAGDPVWKDYLSGRTFSAMEQFSMPFWASETGGYGILFIMEDPFYTTLSFQASPDLRFSVNSGYPAIDAPKTKRFRIYLTEKDPVSVAKLYRNYVRETGQFVTLEQKAEKNPDVRKLYGAPFIYLWGERVISPENINWQEFRGSLDSNVMDYLASFAPGLENGGEYMAVIGEIRSQDYVAAYQKNVICDYISQVLARPDFYHTSALEARGPEMERLLKTGYENLNEPDKIQVNKYALAANLPGVFQDAGGWMEQETTGLLRQMRESGIHQAWIGLNSWEQAYAKPELVDAAADAGYLIASYDSYHSIHEPGNEKWITARFQDASLYEMASVTNKNGEKEKGFQGVGRKLNPTLSFPEVKERMQTIMEAGLAFNSWFIDCDATGEIYDDYTPEHVTTQRDDLNARLERMAYIRDNTGMVIGSEGGNDFAASTIAFAHGIELQSFSWMDDDMKKNKDSEYYIGKYYSPSGGVAEHFSKRIPIKSRFRTLFTDPGYDLPLFKLVYNDSVITSYHWDWSTFKIQGLTSQRMLREILYNVPPLYHLDSLEWNKYKDDIVRYTGVWAEFSRQAIMGEMTDFKYLTEDGSVQMTAYGDNIRAVANYSAMPFQYENQEIPGGSILMDAGGDISIYTPETAPQNS